MEQQRLSVVAYHGLKRPAEIEAIRHNRWLLHRVEEERLECAGRSVAEQHGLDYCCEGWSLCEFANARGEPLQLKV